MVYFLSFDFESLLSPFFSLIQILLNDIAFCLLLPFIDAKHIQNSLWKCIFYVVIFLPDDSYTFWCILYPLIYSHRPYFVYCCVALHRSSV